MIDETFERLYQDVVAAHDAVHAHWEQLRVTYVRGDDVREQGTRVLDPAWLAQYRQLNEDRKAAQERLEGFLQIQ